MAASGSQQSQIYQWFQDFYDRAQLKEGKWYSIMDFWIDYLTWCPPGKEERRTIWFKELKEKLLYGCEFKETGSQELGSVWIISSFQIRDSPVGDSNQKEAFQKRLNMLERLMEQNEARIQAISEKQFKLGGFLFRKQTQTSLWQELVAEKNKLIRLNRAYAQRIDHMLRTGQKI